MIVLFDMDDVLCDHEGDFLKRWRERHPDLPHIPLERRHCFKITRQYLSECGATADLVKNIRCAPGFVAALTPIPGALEAVREITARGHATYLCTAPMNGNPTCASEKFEWVVRHLGQEYHDRVIITNDKTLVRGDLLIDDKPEIRGALVPTWEQVLYDFAYNRGVTGKRRITWDNWREVLTEL